MPPRSMSRQDVQRWFAERAAGLEERFPDDGPRYARAAERLGPSPGAVVLDAGCGTGRGLPWLRKAVGPDGVLIGLDLTWEMLEEARRLGRQPLAQLVQADLLELPLLTASVDAVLAAGLLPHLADPVGGLRELARVTRPAGRLALFHPVSRAELVRRHGDDPELDRLLSPEELGERLEDAGWKLEEVDDSEAGYLALASREPA